MSLRVDLIKPEEQRYQGPVSQRFMLAAGGLLLLTGLIFWIGSALYKQSALQAELKTLESSWTEIEPRYNAAKARQAEQMQIQATENELRAWNSTRLDLASLLDELGQNVPATIQITKLMFRSEWGIVRPPAPPPPPPSDDGSDAQPKPPPPAPGVPARTTIMNLTGRAAGDEGSDGAVKLVQDLKKSAAFTAVFENIKLNNLLRDVQPGDQADRSFTMDAAGRSRKLQ